MNNKGFTLVEILGAVTILAILTALAIAGYTKYIDYSKNKAYVNMAKSATIAAEEFIIDNPGIAVETEQKTENGKTVYVLKDDDSYGVSFAELIASGYLSGAADPSKKGAECRGYVKVGVVPAQEEGALDQYIYEVDECCSVHYGRYKYLVSKKGDEIQAVEEVDTSMDRETICPTLSFKIVEYTGPCGDEYSGGGRTTNRNSLGASTGRRGAVSNASENEFTFYYEEGMTLLDWTRSKHGRSYVDEEIDFYGYSESERSYVEEILAYELNSLLTGCRPEGCPYDGYEEECPLKQIQDGMVIRRNRDCYIYTYGMGTYGYYSTSRGK